MYLRHICILSRNLIRQTIISNQINKCSGNFCPWLYTGSLWSSPPPQWVTTLATETHGEYIKNNPSFHCGSNRARTFCCIKESAILDFITVGPLKHIDPFNRHNKNWLLSCIETAIKSSRHFISFCCKIHFLAMQMLHLS